MSHPALAFGILSLSTAVLLCACAAETARPLAADLVLRNAKVVTVDDEHPEAEAVAVRDDRIVAVGSDAEIGSYIGAGTEVVDLGGQLLIPGFVEGHAHFMALGDSKLILDLRDEATWQEIVDRVAEAVEAAEPGEVIRGRGWHQDKWTHPPEPAVEGFPVHDSLSAVSPDNPVVLIHSSGHAAFVNAAALERADIDRATPDPPGGEILRDASGRATGLLRETAQDLVRPEALAHVPGTSAEPSRATARRMVELASRECLSKGITTFTDAGSSFDTIDRLTEAAEDGALGVRLWVMVRDSYEEMAEKLAAYKGDRGPDHMLEVGGVKLMMDGALGSRGAWMLEPYSDQPDSTGLQLIPLEEVRRTAELAIDEGYQLCIHAIGDRANREVLDIYEQTFAAHPDHGDLRWRIEHAQHLDPADIPRFGELDVIASMQGIHCTSDGPWVPERIGDRRAEEGAYVWRKLADTGALIVNGTDAPVEDVDPIASYYASVSRRLPDGSVFYPEQRMDRFEALRTYTLNGAYAIFEEDSRGSITPGKLADLVVLSRDILTVPEAEIPQAEVVMTILGGEVVYRAPAPEPPRG